MSVWTPQKNTWATAGSSDRTKGPIADALDTFLLSREPPRRILEVASGFGDHITVFAQRHPDIHFQPSEAQPECLEKLVALDLPNVPAPIKLNVLDDTDWSRISDTYDGIININMIHISPWQSTLDLFSHAARVLSPNGFILLYGAYLTENGTFSSEGDAAFDVSLKMRDSSFGLRHPDEVDAIARGFNFTLVTSLSMAINNRLFIWRLEQTKLIS